MQDSCAYVAECRVEKLNFIDVFEHKRSIRKIIKFLRIPELRKVFEIFETMSSYSKQFSFITINQFPVKPVFQYVSNIFPFLGMNVCITLLSRRA